MCHTTVLLMASHCPPHPTDPRKSLEPDVAVQNLPFQRLGPDLGSSASPKQVKTFLSTMPFPVFSHGLQLSALTCSWGGFVSNSPQWGPLILQVTSTCPSDFTFSSSCIILLSVPELHKLNTKIHHGTH